MKPFLFLPFAALLFAMNGCAAAPEKPAGEAANSYTAISPQSPLPSIVVKFSDAAIDWKQADDLNPYTKNASPAITAADFLREAVWRMTGKKLPISDGGDFSKGIVLLTLAQAPDDLKHDPKVLRALADNGQDSYNANEAFYIRSEPKRVVVIANTQDGLLDGTVALLESVDYEVLGMGPNWTYVPDYKTRPVIFSVDKEGRPGFYIRYLGFASGQPRIGTLYNNTLPDPADEKVATSYERWMTGTRMQTRSMPDFPGHALQDYNHAVLAAMWAAKTTQGFLTPKTSLAPDAERPPVAADNNGEVWINSDAAGQPGAGKVFFSNGTAWLPQNGTVPAALDLSVPLVRETIFGAMKKQAAASFSKSPDGIFVFATDPEDGSGYADFGKEVANRNWYPEYLASEGVKFAQPYVLNGFKGLNQPKEIWDPASPTDTVFGFNNWLLREFDKWIDSLPEKDRVTATGKSKKDLVRASLLSYNYHDVPPDFNLDPRIRLMIAGYPKFRGQGKWQNVSTQSDIGQAFKIMLPREPSGDYWILSLAYYYDNGLSSIAGSESAAAIHQRVKTDYDSGFKSVIAEVDLNFGKKGLGYYLYSKMLWNPQMTAEQLDAIRTRWLQRAFGAGWQEMKAHYDFMTPEKFTINSPNNWAKAIRFIQAADAKIADGSMEQKRLDDVKQFWYFYFLLDTSQAKPPSRALREFVWKGQMSYMTAMFMVEQRFFNTNSAFVAAGPEFNTDPAHYTHEETQQWWAKILDHWKLTPVHEFADAILADGTKGSDVDVNDLVSVAEFQSPQDTPKTFDRPFFYNSYEQKTASFLTIASAAGEEIGLKMFWPWKKGDRLYGSFEVPYGISHWNLLSKKWDDLVDIATTSQKSQPTEPVAWRAGEAQQVVTVRYKVPAAGTYRIDLGRGGMLAQLAALNYNVMTGEYSGPHAQTYSANLDGLTQSPTYVYIPKGTKNLDLEVWSPERQYLRFFKSLPSEGFETTRDVDISGAGTHTIALEPGEDGNIAMLFGDNFGFPFLYSVPQLWAKSPSALLVPRAVAKADGLTILK